MTEEEKEELFNDLYDSMLKRKKGVRWKPQVKAYLAFGAERIHKVTEKIAVDKYESSVPKTIPLYYPKRREAQAINFRDRIYQGYLTDKYVYEAVTSSFIFPNVASQVGKGPDVARKILKKYLWNYFCKHGNSGYILQIDIRKYYESIPKEKALKMFESKLPSTIYKKIEEILTVQYPNKFFAGSQLVQILGVGYLDKLDHFIKEELGIRYYIRYQDDFILIHHNKDKLIRAREEIKRFLNTIGLELNYGKTHIRELKKQFFFLGFYYVFQDNGRVWMKINPERVKHIRKVMKKNPDCLEPFLAHLKKGNSYKLIRRLQHENNIKRRTGKKKTDRTVRE